VAIILTAFEMIISSSKLYRCVCPEKVHLFEWMLLPYGRCSSARILLR
jgi:hypothetical protein